MPAAQLYFEDVREGDAIRPAREYFEQMQLVRWSVISKNHDANHFALFHSRLKNGSDPSVTGQFSMAMICKALTDWAGPGAWVKALHTQYRAWERFHDLKTITGNVTAKRVEDGAHLVEVALTMTRSDGTVTCRGTAWIALPVRGG